MIDKKILIVAPYPIVEPIHGGQKRAKALYDYYKTIFSNVTYTGVFHRGQYPEWGPDDILLSDSELIRKVDENPHASELVSGKAIDNDIHVRSHIAKFLMEQKPDVIHIEQPYPYLGLGPLLLELNMNPKLIFGSQNTEYVMKDSIYRGLKMPAALRKSLVEEIKKLEEELSQKADLVIAVNERDAEVHKRMGAKKCLVVPNGIEKRSPTKKSKEFWGEFKRKKNIEKIILFISGGHPPNWQGFLETVGTDTRFIPERSKIIIAGGIADYFAHQYKDHEKFSNFWSGVELIGILSEDKLGALLDASDLILLPIKSGGGSNLKTAEAILSRKKIVATKYAIRGFEAYENLPNINIAESQKFNARIVEALHRQYVEPTPDEVRLSEQVQWKYCLQPLGGAVEALVEQKHKRIIKRVKRGLGRGKK